MRRRVTLLIMGAVAVVACNDITPLPLPERQCTNAILPVTFHMEYWTGTGSGTASTGTLTNRYVLPHRSADTIPLGGGSVIVTNGPTFRGDQCLTLFDSLWTWLPDNAAGTAKVASPSVIEVLQMRRNAAP